MSTPPTMTTLVQALQTLAPLEYAEAWDNVGLLVEPPHTDTTPWCERPCRRVFLTIDLDEAVLNEALQWGAETIVSYHPPIFRGFKRLTMGVSHQRVILRSIQAGLAIYSPHTALDATAHGMTDWLLSGLGPLSAQGPIVPRTETDGTTSSTVGMGRYGSLAEPQALNTLVVALKTHLGLDHLRVAAAAVHVHGEAITEVAVCPGAGASVFEDLSGCELLVTGEMRHHDILAHVASGRSVILSDHTNSERGYLPIFAQKLQHLLGDTVDICISQLDRDPLVVT